MSCPSQELGNSSALCLSCCCTGHGVQVLWAETSWHRELPISREAGGSSCWTLHPRSLQRDPVRPPSQRRKSRNAEGWLLSHASNVARSPRARQELTGAALAPKNEEILQEMKRQRSEVQVRPIPPAVLEFEPDTPLTMDRKIFHSCLQGGSFRRRTKSRVAALVQTMAETLSLLLQAAEDFAWGHVPDDVCRQLMLATTCGLQKRMEV